MQYLLTEEEYAELHAVLRHEREKAREALQRACTLAADHVPVTLPWAKDAAPRPWGCIRSRPSPSGYCDECPVKDICPHDKKRWSK